MAPKNSRPKKRNGEGAAEEPRRTAIPGWVPDPVAKIAPLLPEPTQQLLRDSRMKKVWQELRKRAPNDISSKLKEDERGRLQLLIEFADLPEQDVSGPDKACLAFFISVAWIVGTPGGRHVWTKAQADEQASQWEKAAASCRWVAHEPMFPKHRFAAAEMASFFEEHAVSLRKRGYLANLDLQIAPYVLGRSSGSRGDDKIRGYTRAIAVDARRLFGSFSYRTVATVATVALGKDVSQKSVQSWCKDL